jgi:hypothetical protein
MRDSLVKVEGTFPDFKYADKLHAKGQARSFHYNSPLPQLHWWQERLPMLLEMEKRMVFHEYVAVAVNPDHGLALLAAVEWFIKRHHCRPPGIAEGLQGVDLLKETEMNTDPSDRSLTELPKTGMDGLSPADRRSVESVRAYEESDFSFLDDLLPQGQKKAAPEGNEAEPPVEPAESEIKIDPKEFTALDDIDRHFFGSVGVQRAEAPDGFRQEDRDGLNRFRQYVALSVKEVTPLKARFLEGPDKELGQKLFAYGQLLFSASFPNADSAKMREEDMAAERARVEREAEEKAQQQGGGQAH